ncbi:MAG: RNHCP domain-containing protein [Microgenomates group bacterium]|jgi:hypothetical protein
MKSIKSDDFECINCYKKISASAIGTANRNHCPDCLYSKHVDFCSPGDRKATCQQKMKPIGLTFKNEGKDKYGNDKHGEIMIIHQCLGCNRISINRIAGDDDPQSIFDILNESKNLDLSSKLELESANIRLITDSDLNEVNTQLFGKK